MMLTIPPYLLTILLFPSFQASPQSCQPHMVIPSIILSSEFSKQKDILINWTTDNECKGQSVVTQTLDEIP